MAAGFRWGSANSNGGPLHRAVRAAAVFVGRLLPVIRTFIALPAGNSPHAQGQISPVYLSGIVALVFRLAYCGMKLGENWRYLGKYLHKFDVVVGVVELGSIIWFISSHWQHRLRPGRD